MEPGGLDATFVNNAGDAGLRLLVFGDNPKVLAVSGFLYDQSRGETFYLQRPRTATDLPYLVVKKVYAILDMWEADADERTQSLPRKARTVCDNTVQKSASDTARNWWAEFPLPSCKPKD
jgi:hypothetical protein